MPLLLLAASASALLLPTAVPRPTLSVQIKSSRRPGEVHRCQSLIMEAPLEEPVDVAEQEEPEAAAEPAAPADDKFALLDNLTNIFTALFGIYVFLKIVGVIPY